MNMNHKQALKILGLKLSATRDDIKAMYRHLCSKYHPDRNPAGVEMMKLINGARESLDDFVASMTVEEANKYEEQEDVALSDELNAALNVIIGLGLTIEICGSWIWVSGDTKPYKDVLKAAGYRYAPKKVMWSF